MKIDANTIDEFFLNSGMHAETLRQTDSFIQNHMPDLDHKLYTSGTTCVLGYGEIPYKNTNYSGTIPIISLAPQKNNVSLYVMAWKDGRNLAETYAGRLGKASYGKSCIRFKRLSDLHMEEVQKLLADIHEIYRSIIKNSEV